MVGFLVKLLVISAGLAYGIKYLAPLVSIAPTSGNALIGVCVPPLLIGLILLGRSRQPIQPRPGTIEQSESGSGLSG